ncbi:MAG: lysophospholipid acyltransferase family protein [Ignavibacteriaceae bacterium]|nr:lysophospholipid acyltransferase family protein [Ignavibacteriaceae bacterium]MCU0364737.1 lysophospholipid acyltransferase family protein [Ignavibacteriaceae bacterium]MCU0414111.1 lysophospholipid acyltransferase family protein [Ignavibacteriaceae bacterium]
MRKNFSNFFLVNLPPELPKNKSVIITPNHMSWWDGFFLHQVNIKSIKKNLYFMMLRKQLDRFWFFKYLGAYSIQPDNPKSISETIRYTKKILVNHKNAVAFYPQGEIEPYDKRPINLKGGLQLFLRDVKNECVVLPIAFKIQYYNEKYPAIIFRSGGIISANEILNDFNVLESEFVANLDALNESASSKKFAVDLFAGI